MYVIAQVYGLNSKENKLLLRKWRADFKTMNGAPVWSHYQAAEAKAKELDGSNVILENDFQHEMDYGDLQVKIQNAENHHLKSCLR